MTFPDPKMKSRYDVFLRGLGVYIKSSKCTLIITPYLTHPTLSQRRICLRNRAST